MAVKRKNEAGAPAFTGAQLLTFDRYRERRDLLGVLLDNALGETYIRMAVMLFFVGNEGLSLLENLGLMGVPFPAFLERALEALREQGDNGKGGSNANP